VLLDLPALVPILLANALLLDFKFHAELHHKTQPTNVDPTDINSVEILLLSATEIHADQLISASQMLITQIKEFVDLTLFAANLLHALQALNAEVEKFASPILAAELEEFASLPAIKFVDFVQIQFINIKRLRKRLRT